MDTGSISNTMKKGHLLRSGVDPHLGVDELLNLGHMTVCGFADGVVLGLETRPSIELGGFAEALVDVLRCEEDPQRVDREKSQCVWEELKRH
jgi:hypothetical protein